MSGPALGRQLHTGDLVGTLLFLISDAGGPITGQTLIADGGVRFPG